MVEPFPLDESLHFLIEELLSRICLHSSRLPAVCLIEALCEGGQHLFSRLVLDRHGPALLAEDFDNWHNLFHTLALGPQGRHLRHSASTAHLTTSH